MKAEISAIQPSVEGVVTLFDALKRFFAFRKGALLTRNRESAYFLPLAQTGLDVTSRNRLRFPVESLGHVADTPGKWLSPDGFEDLRPYLSSREFDLIEELLILPIPTENGIAGILLIISEDEEELETLRRIEADELSAFQQQLGKFFDGIKIFSLETAHRELNDEAGLKAFIRRSLEQQKLIGALRFDLSPLLERLVTISSDVDLFRARKDTLRIIETLFESNARLWQLGEDRFLLLMGTKNRQNPKLLQHQVGLALRNFFSSDIAGIEFEAVDLSETADSADELMQELESLVRNQT